MEHVTRGSSLVAQVTLSTDLIVGFCGETEADHEATLDLLRTTGYEQAFLFAYSRRDKTHAARHLEDDVPAEVKKRRLNEAIALFRERQAEQNQLEIGRFHLVRPSSSGCIFCNVMHALPG